MRDNDPADSWVKLNGTDGYDISVNERGDFFLVNKLGKLYQYESPNWKEITVFKNVRFYIENKGIQVRLADGCLMKKECQQVGASMRLNSTSSCGWRDPKDMAVGSDSTIWHLTYWDEIWASKCGNSYSVPGSNLSRIAAGNGQVWMINRKGLVYRLKDPLNVKTGWEQIPGQTGRDITISNDGQIFLVNNQGNIFQWNGTSWDQIEGNAGYRIAANNGKMLLISTGGEMYSRSY